MNSPEREKEHGPFVFRETGELPSDSKIPMLMT